jgi:hypothetical protein
VVSSFWAILVFTEFAAFSSALNGLCRQLNYLRVRQCQDPTPRNIPARKSRLFIIQIAPSTDFILLLVGAPTAPGTLERVAVTAAATFPNSFLFEAAAS